ncbi:hypothetical protein BC835DRAFT_1424874 [Cytidiella melzeri]|nr:hypothetical protein BC835DRAFT_1424874 [Cytidiella melzeri]
MRFLQLYIVVLTFVATAFPVRSAPINIFAASRDVSDGAHSGPSANVPSMGNQNAGTSKGKRGRPAVLVRTPSVEDSQFATNPTSLRTRQNALESRGKKVIASVDHDADRKFLMGLTGVLSAIAAADIGHEVYEYHQCRKKGNSKAKCES